MIRALNKSTIVDEKIETSLFQIFGDDMPPVSYYLYDFHEYFDGLIGNDILSDNGFCIDYSNKQLIRGNIKININYKPVVKKYEYKVTTVGISKIKIPVDREHGDAYIEEQDFGPCVLIGGMYSSNNWEAEIYLECKKHCKLEINQPIICTDVETLELNNLNLGSMYESNEKTIDIDMNHLNTEEKKALRKLLCKYQNIFYKENQKLSFTNKVRHEIKTTDELPVYSKTYRYPYIHKEEVQNQITKMLEENIIRPSNSPWSSPIWIVPKKLDKSGNKKWRMVVDYRKLNEKTIDDRYLIPNISEILDKLGRCMYFTTLDLASGFHQIEVNDNDIKKTAFSVEHGHYEYTRMPFGLKNAPATFQRVMDSVLRDLQNKICLVYMDDIIIFSSSLTEHIQNLEKVFIALEDANLKIQMDKSEFLQKEVAFLGHIVTRDGIKPNPNKISAVQQYPIPKTPKEVKQFSGLLGYYRKFIKDFARMTKPMTMRLKKGRTINVNDTDYKECFEISKKLLTESPILAYPDFSKQFILTTDASDFALGGVLSQMHDGKEHPICYASRTLNDHEVNYSTIEKELLAIVWTTKYFRPYIFGRKIKIQTDHRPLNWLMSLKEPNSKLVRWRLKLEEYDYTIEYKPGKINNNADALSRIPLEVHVNEAENTSTTTDDSDGNNSDNMSVNATIDDNDNMSTVETVHSAESDNFGLIPISQSSLNKFKNQFIISKISSGAASFSTKKVFNNTRKIIKLKNIDEETIVLMMKNHFNPKQVNAIFVEQNDVYLIIQDAYRKYFIQGTSLHNSKTRRHRRNGTRFYYRERSHRKQPSRHQ